MNRERAAELATSTRAKILYSLLAVAVLSLVVLWISVTYAGILATILYVILFFGGLTLFPLLLALLGNQMPFSSLTGKLHIMLGAFSFNHHYLVQLTDKWAWCPGDVDRVYIDGQWHEIEGGKTNRSVLGWRPFGILRYKDSKTLKDARVDTAAERARGATTDGGTIERAGIEEISPDAVTGIDGEWLLDLKRVFSRGIKKIGDIELVETAEEVIERGQVTTSRIEGWKPVIGAALGILLGCVMGYFMFFA